jgi:uncharacterized membrane protein
MINNIEQYLTELKKELASSDRALIQDALSDAEEYLRTALDQAREAKPEISESEALVPIIEKYGLPAEVATAYKEIEIHTSPSFSRPILKEKEIPATAPPPPPVPPVPVTSRSLLARFFGIFADARAWGSLFYLLFAMATGIIYFTWVITGLSTSAGMLVIIIGIPLLLLFLLSVRGIALIEGRLVEALLGVRMPRRQLFSPKDAGLWQKVKSLITERHTWTAMVYMVLQMPLGIIYFTVIITLIATSLWLVVWPIVAVSLNLPVFIIWPYEYYMSAWGIPIWIILGGLLLTATMHIVKFTGRLHGTYAKAMLVKE